MSPPTEFSMRLSPVSEEEVFKYKNDNKSNAAGFDEIDPRILKYVADIIKKPLAHIINRTIKTGIFSSELKTAKIIPLHK